MAAGKAPTIEAFFNVLSSRPNSHHQKKLSTNYELKKLQNKGVRIARPTQETKAFTLNLKFRPKNRVRGDRTSQRSQSPIHLCRTVTGAWRCRTLLATDWFERRVGMCRQARSTLLSCAACLECYCSTPPTAAPMHTLPEPDTPPFPTTSKKPMHVDVFLTLSLQTIKTCMSQNQHKTDPHEFKTRIMRKTTE